jgi:hypothetical protein
MADKVQVLRSKEIGFSKDGVLAIIRKAGYLSCRRSKDGLFHKKH